MATGWTRTVAFGQAGGRVRRSAIGRTEKVATTSVLKATLDQAQQRIRAPVDAATIHIQIFAK
jgi:hypothetical protein